MTLVLHRVAIFFFNDTATTEIYTLSLHDALPISIGLVPLVETSFLPLRSSIALMVLSAFTSIRAPVMKWGTVNATVWRRCALFVVEPHSMSALPCSITRSEEHTSELQSQSNLVCRLLLEKKKNKLDI